MTTQELAARDDYQQRLSEARQQLESLKERTGRMVWIRTAFFVMASGGLLLGYGGAEPASLLVLLGWLAALAFLVAIVLHERLRLQKLQRQSDERLFERLIARVDRNWSELTEVRLLPEFSGLSCAYDLDVAGSASLLSLLSLAGTPPGVRTLQSWLAENSTWSEVQQRQAAVRAMTRERELRLSIIRTVLSSSDGTEDVYGLPNWATSEPWLPRNRLAHGLSYLGPVLIACGAFLAAGAILLKIEGISANLAVGLLSAGLITNVLVTAVWGSWLHDIFQQVTGSHQACYQFAEVFSSLENLPQDGGLLDGVRQTALHSETGARTGFAQLLQYVRLANLQRDPLSYLIYLFLQLTLLYDFRVLKLLERWQARFGPHVTKWFEALGISEAVICGATLADEYPQWTFPQPLADESLHLVARGIGHPLLPDGARVSNDLLLSQAQPLLLVTGSNMAGKSTFLRALGLNLLLARTGSCVCATELAAPLFELATSIRVQDSLRDGVSFFMAELKRLKEVVDVAHTRSGDKHNPILFLLDEILQGTNSRERQLAVTTVVERLLSYGACGALSTHDLDLATVEEIARVSQIVHFREFFESVDGREVMRFDYQMRSGPTPTTNALKLLALVGLTEAD